MMKINNVSHSGLNPYKQNLQKIDGNQKAPFQGKDEIEISKKAKELQYTSSFAAERKEKIEAIKVSLENGTYSLNARETAKSILNFYKK